MLKPPKNQVKLVKGASLTAQARTRMMKSTVMRKRKRRKGDNQVMTLRLRPTSINLAGSRIHSDHTSIWYRKMLSLI